MRDRQRRRAEDAERAGRLQHGDPVAVGVALHRQIVGMIVEIETGDRQPVLVPLGGMERHPVGGDGHVLAVHEQARDALVGLNPARVVAAPAPRTQERRVERQAKADGAIVVAAGKAAGGIEPGFVANDARGDQAAVHAHGSRKFPVHVGGHVAHVVLAEHARAVGEPIWPRARLGVEQQPRGLDRICSDADQPRLLKMVVSERVGVEDAADAAARVVLDAEHHAAGTNLAAPRGFGARQLGDEGGPLAAGAAALNAEADLVASIAAVAGQRVDRQVVGAEVSVAHALRAEGHDPDGIGGPVKRDPVPPGDAHLDLGLAVEGLHLLIVEWPVLQGGTVHVAVRRAHLELVVLGTRTHGGPVEGGAAQGLAGPGGRSGVVTGDGRAAGAVALVLPGEKVIHRPLVVDEVARLEARAGLQQNHVDAAPGQLVGHGAAAGAGADDHDDAVVVQVVSDGRDIVVVAVRRNHSSTLTSSSEIQSISSKPRSM